MVLLLLVVALPFGCVAFPRGAYWPAYQSRLAEGAAADADVAAGAAPDWSDAARAEALRRRLRGAVARRWSNQALADAASDTGAGAGRYVYGAALRTLVALYVDPVSYRDLVVAGIESLRAALEDEAFRERFPRAGKAEHRARLAEALGILSLKARAARPIFSWQATEWLDVAMEKNRAMLGLPDGAVVAEFLFGATDALDPYTRFMTAEMLGAYERRLKGEYAGIGAAVAKHGDRVFLEEVFEGGAAEEAGFAVGDEIVRVDAEPVRGLDLAEVSRRLRGEKGTEVRVTVRSGGEGEARTVTLTRTAVGVPSVRTVQMIEGEDAVGYLRLTAFKSGTERELRKAVADLRGRGARRLLVDLRGNPGGSLLEAIAAAAVFLDAGRVLETRGRAFGADWTYDVPLFARQEWSGPLVLLVDEGTASAAEALALALSQRGRARLVGRRTYGKGAAQISVPILGTGTAVTVTVARVYGPDEACVEGVGLEPDRAVPAPEAAVRDVADDPVVRAAIDLLQGAPNPPAARP
ncbi:MAG: S41 family peptidase [Phycisphaerae bacterium]